MKKNNKTDINIKSKGGIILKNIIDFKIEEKKVRNKRKINKKKMIITISIIVLALVIGITMLLYYSSRDVRNFLDQYLFRKKKLKTQKYYFCVYI